MAGPSNIRVNPFTGTGGATNYVELTEKHVIPAVSPYVIRLNEVPEKQDPSNMKMVYVNESTGAATSTTLTEVAATPGKGEFRPDYSTNALEDKTWNTGLIEFSASDAGKIVQVTYTGTGTLAGVNSNNWPSWYTDRGDGSDGDFVPTENTTISGVKNYKSVFIKSGITVTVSRYLKIKCQGAFICLGTITADGQGGKGRLLSERKGYSGDETPADNVIFCSAKGGAGGRAGYSATYYNGGAGGTSELGVVGDFGEVCIGAGGGVGAVSSVGGDGGAGGGCLRIIANTIKVAGKITANGNNGTAATSGPDGNGGGGGGGGGGLLILVANNIIKTGTVTANGGSGGASTSHSGGGEANGVKGDNGICKLIEIGAL